MNIFYHNTLEQKNDSNLTWVLDRGCQFGDGVFETMRINKGCIALFAEHWARLNEGCNRLHISVDWEQLNLAIETQIQGLDHAILKLIVTRGLSHRGYQVLPGVSSHAVLTLQPLPKHLLTPNLDAVSLFDCQTRLAIQPVLAGIKHLNRLEQVLARMEWDNANYADGVMLDTEGHVVECVSSNLLWFSGGRLHLPSLEVCGVKGVMRKVLLGWAEQLNIPTVVERFFPEALQDADEVMISNSIFGVRPVCSWRGFNWPPGAQTASWQRQINGMWL